MRLAGGDQPGEGRTEWSGFRGSIPIVPSSESTGSRRPRNDRAAPDDGAACWGIHRAGRAETGARTAFRPGGSMLDDERLGRDEASELVLVAVRGKGPHRPHGPASAGHA